MKILHFWIGDIVEVNYMNHLIRGEIMAIRQSTNEPTVYHVINSEKDFDLWLPDQSLTLVRCGKN